MAFSKPTIVKNWYNIDGDTETSRQLSTSGGIEIVAVIVTPGEADCVVRVYDSRNGEGPKNKSFLLEADAASGSKVFSPNQPILFNEGLYVDIELGGSQGGEVFIAYN